MPRVSKEEGVRSGVEVSALPGVLPVLRLLPGQPSLLPASIHMSAGQRRDAVSFSGPHLQLYASKDYVCRYPSANKVIPGDNYAACCLLTCV